MRTLNDYMAMNYRMEIVEDTDEGGFVVSFPELPGCITCGENIESAIANAMLKMMQCFQNNDCGMCP